MSEMARIVGSSSTKTGKRTQPGAESERSRLCQTVRERDEEPTSEVAETTGKVLPPPMNTKISVHDPSMAKTIHLPNIKML